ncbi:MAG TPA: hypothetical protein VK837_12600 [Longimicrobiales bacterium]|nr:hypothetical protein [Longimicrobiales bacterium]
MPGFGDARAGGDSIAIVRRRFEAFYADGGTRELTLGEFLAPLPRSHRSAFAARYYGAGEARTPAEVRGRSSLARARLQEISPGRPVDSLVVLTERLILHPLPDSAVVPLSRYAIALAGEEP